MGLECVKTYQAFGTNFADAHRNPIKNNGAGLSNKISNLAPPCGVASQQVSENGSSRRH